MKEKREFEKYKFVRYSNQFSKLYKKEREKLRKILSNAKIEHIGSTAIPGLGGKGIIDIIIAVQKKQIKKAIKKLQKHNYDYRPFKGDKERKFFQKIIKHLGKQRRVHLQLTNNNSHTWKASIAVRNYLRNNKKEIERYSNIKEQAVKLGKKGKEYRKYKKKYLDCLELNSLKT